MNEQLKQAVYNYNNQFPPFSYRSIDIFEDLNLENNMIGFLEYLANQPTCTPNERKFLDEIRKKFTFDGSSLVHCEDNDCILHSIYFKSNLSELVGEK